MTQLRRSDRDERDDARGAPSGAPAQVVRVRLLGGFSVSVGTRVIEEGRWRLKRAVNLVKLLVLAPAAASTASRSWTSSGPDLSRNAASNGLRHASMPWPLMGYVLLSDGEVPVKRSTTAREV